MKLGQLKLCYNMSNFGTPIKFLRKVFFNFFWQDDLFTNMVLEVPNLTGYKPQGRFSLKLAKMEDLKKSGIY